MRVQLGERAEHTQGQTMPIKQNEAFILHRTVKKEWKYITHGQGVYLFDTDGKRYLDAAAGVHVVSIGHGVKEVIDAMQQQANKVCFTYGRFLTQAQVELAEQIVQLTPELLTKVFFISGGSEATESAVKMARKYHIETGNPQKYKVISRWQSWHGNTLGALSLSGERIMYPICWIFRTFPHHSVTAVHTMTLILTVISDALRN